MLHRLAFGSSAVQLTAADIESTVYGSRYRHVTVQRPVFITSLPRAGTTLVLEMLTKVAALATHKYRDMPFILAPILWETMSKGFQKPSDLRERAHGDGMLVGYDSAEAFEEILWKTFWPEKYKDDRIELWSANEDADEFRDFFLEHMRKIIALRSTGEAAQRRYVSKNNANVARIGLLRRLFPDSLIVIPVRDPVGQARSLLRQHRRFLSLHKEDPFSKRYMGDLGHLEFGELHRPLAFPGMDAVMARYSPDELDYWIAYWTKAFTHILRFKDDVLCVSYERLCEKGTTGLRAITQRLGFKDEELRNAAPPEFHEPRENRGDAGASDRQLLEGARTLYDEFLARSIV